MTTVARAGLDEVPAEVQKPARAQSRKRPMLIGAVLLALGGGGAWYLTHLGLENTDDAQVDADVVAVPARVGGTISKILFVENQRVKTGDLLAELDDAPVKARLAEKEAALASALATADAMDAAVQIAEANAVGNKSVAEAGLQTAAVGVTSFSDQIAEGESQVHAAETNLAQSTSDYERDKALFASNSIPKVELDRMETTHIVAESTLAGARARLATVRESATQARTRVVEASARVKQSNLVEPLAREARARASSAHAEAETARAARDLAALDLSYTKITAPHDGVVSKKTINEGQAISIGQAVVQLVTPQTWVTANFKETQVGSMRIGQPAEFSVDAYPGVTLTGDVESLSGATGARFSLLAPDNASGNFTKVVQRVPVRIHVRDMPAGVALRPGMSVDLTVDTRK